MSLQNDDAVVSGYGSSDETASLLVLSKNKHTIVPPSQSRGSIATFSASVNGPASTSAGTSKPVLTRQECTSSYLISPNTSQRGGSEESTGYCDDDSQQAHTSMAIRPYQQSLSVNATSVPDLDAQYHLEAPVISISAQSCRNGHRGSVSGYQLNPQSRCRTCRTCERRASTTPVSSLYLARSVRTNSKLFAYSNSRCPFSSANTHNWWPCLREGGEGLLTFVRNSTQINSWHGRPFVWSWCPCVCVCVLIICLLHSD